MTTKRRAASPTPSLSVLEICAGAGGQSLGLECAGFLHASAIDNDPAACATLRLNRPNWNVVECDVRDIDGSGYRGVDVVAGGVPCPPFSIAGKQLGRNDERDLFPEALRIVATARPAAVMFENVRGFASSKFSRYRSDLLSALAGLGYEPFWRLLNASDFGVPQLRPRFILVAIRPKYAADFRWPEPDLAQPTVAATIADLMGARGWTGISTWLPKAQRIAPTIVGGSKKHGGPDLGPSRARREWLRLGVDGRGIANAAPSVDDAPDHLPRLTLGMVARLQGFDDSWRFSGRKTAAYRQIGNAFPAPVAFRVASAIRSALIGGVPSPTTPKQSRFGALIPVVTG